MPVGRGPSQDHGVADIVGCSAAWRREPGTDDDLSFRSARHRGLVVSGRGSVEPGKSDLGVRLGDPILQLRGDQRVDLADLAEDVPRLDRHASSRHGARDRVGRFMRIGFERRPDRRGEHRGSARSQHHSSLDVACAGRGLGEPDAHVDRQPFQLASFDLLEEPSEIRLGVDRDDLERISDRNGDDPTSAAAVDARHHGPGTVIAEVSPGHPNMVAHADH